MATVQPCLCARAPINHAWDPEAGCPDSGPARGALAQASCWCYVTDGIRHDWNPKLCPAVPVPELSVRTVPPNPSHLPEDKQAAVADLLNWWTRLAERDARTTVPKAVEYGSADLIEIGRAMARATGRTDLTDAQAAELGIYFYVVGKLGRWTAAVEDGRPVSDDTLFDISVYITMVRRIRATGGWPYATEGKPE